jgi:hypothetical protein
MAAVNAGGTPTTPGRPQPPPPSPPPAPPGPPPSYGPSPPGRRSLAWLWILIAVVVIAGAGVGAYLVFSGGDEQAQDGQGQDGVEPGQASVSVQTGLCDPATGTTSVDVAIEPPGSATVTIIGAEGFTQTFTDAGDSASLAPGEYTWTAQPSEGVTLSGESTGAITVESCEEVTTGFTVREQELLAHIPGTIRNSCQQVPAEQQIGRAVASLLCEHAQATLFYDLFPNTGQMETYYDSRVREFGIARGSGPCDSAERAENAYVRSRGDQTFEVGRLLCFRDAGNAVFIWSDTRVDITVEAQRGDPTNDQLYRLWARVEFGPLA